MDLGGTTTICATIYNGRIVGSRLVVETHEYHYTRGGWETDQTICEQILGNFKKEVKWERAKSYKMHVHVTGDT